MPGRDGRGQGELVEGCPLIAVEPYVPQYRMGHGLDTSVNRRQSSTCSSALSHTTIRFAHATSQAALSRHCTASTYSNPALLRSYTMPAMNACCSAYSDTVHTVTWSWPTASAVPLVLPQLGSGSGHSLSICHFYSAMAPQNQLFQGEDRGDLGKHHFWPFDPGLPGHKDPLHSALVWVFPVESLSRYVHLLNVACVPFAQCAHTVRAVYRALLAQKGVDDPRLCNMQGVHQAALGPLRSCTQPLGSILIHCDSSLLCWCLLLFQTASIQSMLQGQDLMMVGPQKARWDNPVGQRRTNAVSHPDEMTSCKNTASKRCLNHPES